jgi:hypothetical protein
MVEFELADGAIATVDDKDERFARLRWYRDSDGYVVRKGPRPNQQKITLHREILGLVKGDGLEGDHKDLDKLNNRRMNLRITTMKQNMQNRPSQTGTSRFRGVSWRPRSQCWRAVGAIEGRNHEVGLYVLELDAARAAEAFRRTHMPFAVPDLALDPVPPCSCRMCRS